MIYDDSPVSNYVGNSSSTIFDFDFLIENKSQLKVTLYDKDSIAHELICDVDYKINQLNNPSGSHIVFPIEGSSYSVLSEEEKISLELVLPVIQTTRFNNSSGNMFKEIEKSFDYLTRLVQILKRKLSLCVNVTEGSKNTPQELMEIINQAQLSAQSYANIAQTSSLSAKNHSEIANVASTKSQEYAQVAKSFKDELVESGMYKFNLFDTKITDHVLEGVEAIGWVLIGNYVDKTLYPDFYETCISQKNSSNAKEFILGDNSTTIFENLNGHKFYNISDKSLIDSYFESNGEAWFYGIDEENEKIFLPRKNIEEYIYICVGNTVVNDADIDAGAIVAQMETKANIQLDNVLPSQEFKNQAISWGMPDLPNANPWQVNLIPWNTAFQLPCDCYVLYGGIPNNTAETAVLLSYSFDNETYYSFLDNWYGYQLNISCLLPKGLYIKGKGGTSSQKLSYIPVKGVN